MDTAQHLGIHGHARQKIAHDAHIRQINRGAGHIGNAQAFPGELQRLKISLQPSMSEDFCAELERLAGGMRTIRPGMQHWPAIAEASHALAIEQMRVNSSDLGGSVRSKPHGSP